MTENRRRGRPFQPGQSGNPAGRPVGARHRATLALESLLDGEGEALTRKAVELALAGDVAALRICMERLCPPRKDRPISINLPKVTTAKDAIEAHSVILEAVAIGDLTPAEGGELVRLVESVSRTIDVAELEERLAVLERERLK